MTLADAISLCGDVMIRYPFLSRGVSVLDLRLWFPASKRASEIRCHYRTRKGKLVRATLRAVVREWARR